MSKAKKILGMAISVMALAATMSMGAMAEPSTVNLMPTDASAITCGTGGTVEMNGDSFVFKAGSADTSFTYPVTMQVDMTITDYFYFDFTATGGWDIKWKSTALNGDVNPGLSSDFGNHFGTEDYGSLLEGSTYAPGDVEIQASGAYTWNDNLPDDGVVTMKSIEVRVGANSELTLNALYFGDMDAAEAVPGATSADTTTEAPATTTTTEADTTASTTTTTAAETTTSATTTTTAAAEDGGNTGLIVGIVVAVVVVAAVAVGVVVYMKKKKKD